MLSPPPGRERLRALLTGRLAAETPVATWRHHPLHDQHADRLAQATLSDQALFAADLVKLTPASTWQLIDHGLEDGWAGDPIGRRRILRPVIHDPADWDQVRPRPADQGFRATILAAVAGTREQLSPTIPLLATVFDPLFVAIGLAGLERFRAHQRQAPQRVAAALRCLQEETLQLIDALAAAGAEGVFLAVQHASPALFPAALYAELALDADRALLAAMNGRLPFSMLHLHGAAVPIGRFQAEPVPFLHYDMGEAGNPPPEAIERPPGCAVATGPSPSQFSVDDPLALACWVDGLRRRMAGRPLLVSPGCALPLAAADALPLAMVHACRPGRGGEAVAGALGVEAAPGVRPLDHGGPIHRAFTPFPAPERIPSVLARFRAVVALHGDRPALLDRQRRWTYRALHERVEALTAVLLGHLGDDTGPVAILLPQDARVPLAQLAVLAAGRLPVPLDPRFPLARNRRILEASGAGLILGDGTDPGSADPALTAGCDWLGLDGEGAAQLPENAAASAVPPDRPAPRPLRGDDPAWLLFTSGSTGVPKGVVQNHRGLLHDVMQYTNAIHLGPDDRLTQLYSASVSGSLRDIYGALLNGACLMPLSLVDHGVAAVLEVIRRERITVLHAVPGLFRLLIEALAPGEILPHVRLLYLAGDRVDRRDVEAFQAHFPAEALLYIGIGSTENSTLYAHHFLAADAPLPPGPVPVGRELPERRLRLVGEDGALVPEGAVGEVECTSRYLAQGYWRDPEATARAFRPCPSDATVRCFRSGDRARLGADGLLRFVGRRDDQLKIAGRRLEPGEVEGALLAVPAVGRALVMALPDIAAGEPILVAWLQGLEGQERPADAELRLRLRAQLPEGLVPVRFVWVERWPLTANGKVDRQALAATAMAPSASAPSASAPAAAVAPEPPATASQRQLHRIWSEVLGHGHFGIHDDFFCIGGHSLAALRVLSRLEQSCSCSLPLSTIVVNPTIASLAAQLDGATQPAGPAQPADGAIPVAAALPLPAGFPAGARAFPASYAQARLWFLHQLQGDLTSYHMLGLWRLRGDLDRPALARALTALVERHPSLRTSFHLQEGTVLQIVHPPAAVPLPLEAPGDRQAEAAISAWFAEESSTPFDLHAGLLLRARLLAVAEHEHRLLLNLHHIASDGWSRVVLARDLSELYNAERSARPPGLPPLRVHVQDHAVWQRQRLQGPPLEQLRQYWLPQLEGLAPLALPGERPRRGGAPLGGDVCRFRVQPDQMVALEGLCRGVGTTLQTGLLAVVALLLHRLCRQDDLAIGVPTWGRPHPDLEDLIGFFLNILPIRSRLEPSASFLAFLAQVRQTSLAAYDHMDLPFDQMVEGVGTEREAGRTPLVSVILQLFELPTPSLQAMEGLQVDTLPCPTPLAKFDLEFFLRREEDGGLSGELIHATDRFGSEAMARLTRQLLTLLDSVLANPEAPVEQLTLLPEQERRQIESWQEGPAVMLPSLTDAESTVDARFAAQVRRTPDAIALCGDEEPLRYRDLHQRAGQVAAELRALGVGPGVLVAVCLERSVGLIVTLLAILQAGGAYLPLDPDWPLERRERLWRQAGCRVLVGPEGAVVLPDPASPLGEAASAGPLPSRSPLAYVTTTSGSTGTPKGVEVEHAAILRLVDPRNGFHLGLGARVLQLAPVAFDAATFEIWGPLLNGGTLVMAPPGPVSLAELAGLLRDQRITTLWLTAGLFDAMVEAELPALARVPQVLAGGDVLSPASVQRLLAAFPPGHGLINGYGPTENTTFTCCHPLAAGERPPSAVPIGRPIAGTRVRVLDAAGRMCPIGVVGELFIGGIGLARGYRNDAERTAAAFVADPYAEEPGARLYRSGDLVSWNPDGTLAFHGRLDGQIKLRGVRIEPGEIEAALAMHPAVAQVAVVLRREDPANPMLVAYWVPVRGEGASADEALAAAQERTAELRAYLGERLPAVMVPAAVVALAALPLTANGKVDRSALPAPSFRGSAPARRSPATAMERQLEALWREVLGHAAFGVEDDFFAVGGHSLAAVRLVSRVAQVCARELPLATVFEQPTIAAQAGLLAEWSEADGGSRAAVVIPRALPCQVDRQGRPAYPASFAQERLWFLHQLQPGLTAYHLPLVWRLRGDLDPAALQATLTALLERHPPLRTSFRLEGDDLLQVVHPAATFPLTPEPLQGPAASAALEAALEEEACTPFDLESGRLLRARLWRLAGADHILLLNLHHIAADGWSLAVLARELVAGLQAHRTGAPPRLPALRVAYADHALWQRQQLRAGRQEPLSHYWAHQLADLPPLPFPSDHAPPVTPSFRGDSLAFTIDAPTLEPFEALCRREGATLQMGVLALVAHWLHRICGQNDLAIGVPIWGRDHPDLEDLIGFFVNTLPIRVRISPGQGFRELLRQVRHTSIAAYAHQELPFEQIVEAVQPDREAGRNPLVSVLVQLIELPPPDLDGLEGLEIERLPLRERRARLDLELVLRREPGGGLVGEVIHATDRFAAEAMARRIRQLLTLLDSLLASPETPLEHLNLLPEEERRQLEAWQEGPQAVGNPMLPERCLPALVAQQARLTPQAPALIAGDHRLTYAELNNRADLWAGALRALGVGSESIVAVCLERSPELVVALLAILKAGAAFLPLDPGAPPARLAQLLALADEPLVLGDAASGGDRLAAARWLDVAALAHPQPQPSACPPEPAEPAGPAAAYLLFTSGTTGTPKAVLVEHRALALRCEGLGRTLGFAPGVRVLAQTTPIFDIAILELLIPLAHGATVVIATDGQRQDPRQLTALIEAQAIDVLQATPSLLGAWAAAGAWPTRPLTLLAGGEPFPVPLAVLLCRPGLRVLNGYGPTEAAIYSTMAELAGAGEAIPIGRPIAGTTVRVLDAAGQLCPIGVVGELHIGGAGLARGYRNDGERTAAAFVPDPHSDEPGARLYRSGDLAAWNADGTLAFHGRRDGQIKLRGVRIEPGEIEAVLAEHAAVAQVAVVLRCDDPANPLLAAYWVPAIDESGGDGLAAVTETTAELRAFLKERLPAVMVPAAFVALAALPLTANGKLDRRALPAPWSGLESPGGQGQGSRAAAGDLERVLMELWQEVLGHAQFGVSDHFFQVGGHSLAVARLAAAVEAALGRSLPVAEVFRHPTIREQAGWLSGVRPASAAPHLVVLQPRGERPPLHVVHGWGGGLADYIDLARALGPHRPVFGLQAHAGAEETATPEPVTVLAERYAEQILARHPGGPIHLLGYSAAGWYAFAVAAALWQRGAPLGLLAVLDTHASARIHRRLGLVLLADTVLPRLGPQLRELALPPSGERRRRLLLRRSRSLNRTLYTTLRLRLPGPERLAAALAGRPFPEAAEDPFVANLRHGYRPPRLPLAVDLFAPPAHHRHLQRLWSFYAQGGVRLHPLFRDHFDFFRPALMPELAQALEQAMAPLERDP